MSDLADDTVKKLPSGKPFKKGFDPRRNLKGVPKDAIAARHLIRKIGAELIHIREKTETGETVEYDIERAAAMIRLMFSSKAPKDKETLMKALWPGLLKDEVNINGDVLTKVIVEYVNSKDTTSPVAPISGADQEGTETAQRD